MARVMHRKREAHAHQTGGCGDAIQSRELNHFDDGLNAAALLADPPGEGLGEFDLGGGVRPVAELVLEPLQTQRVERAVGTKTRHEKTGEAARGLREHEKGIAHRRREKPFMAGDLVFVFRDALRARGVGANIAAALLLRHAHPQSRALLLPERPEGSIVDARGDERHQLHEMLGRGRERGDAGMRHGHGTEMARLDPAREVVQSRARHMPLAVEPSARAVRAVAAAASKVEEASPAPMLWRISA